jgi:DNA-binding NarL/FixJ family response regulator
MALTRLQKIRAVGVDAECEKGCEPEVEREHYSLALFCVRCGWRYDLTETELEAYRNHGRKPRPGPQKRVLKRKDPERDQRVVKAYKDGHAPRDIAQREDISESAVYYALRRQGVELRKPLHKVMA